MAMKVGGSKGGAIADINVTPMADIMIVLLIIFMVVTPLLQKGVDVKLPQARYGEEKDENEKQVVVAINNEGDAFIKGVPKADLKNLKSAEQRWEVLESSFVPVLREEVDGLPDTGKIVYLKAHVDLDYRRVVEVMGACRNAGAEEIALIVDKKVGS
jgi:biopolymer transport protein TolR